MIGTEDTSAVEDVGSRVQGNIQTQGESNMCAEQWTASETTTSVNVNNNRNNTVNTEISTRSDAER